MPLAPDKTVLLPDHAGGHPDVPVVCYVNTSAAVKNECDACCTSANARLVVESFAAPAVIFVPDEHLAGHVAAHTKVRIIAWQGHCEVHQRFTGQEVREYRDAAQAYVLAHPECPRDVQDVADYVGWTAGMIAALEHARRADHRVLDGRRHLGRLSADRFPATLQPLPAHATDHAARHPCKPRKPRPGDRDSCKRRRRRAVQRMLEAGRPASA